MIRSTVHTARKSHWCDTCDRRAIRPGQRYHKAAASPGIDLINETQHWQTFRECADCADRYGRGHLIAAP
ncbi:hypothetical protein ABT324_24180 [Saccharopolyspora sp. NPDC000359]|uniref:hypothetical protein n=1 Tax=Saccharopolyspora sp. NPDC000359 TaxID=3154251 RepID=UPI00331F6D85